MREKWIFQVKWIMRKLNNEKEMFFRTFPIDI